MAKRITIAQLRAENEALRAGMDAVNAENTQLRRALANQASDHAVIGGVRSLMLKQRELTDAGVPCFIQSGVIKHQYTKAILYAP